MKKNINLTQIGYINQKINSSAKLADLLNTIMDIARDMLEAEGSSLLLTDIETEDLIFNVVIGDKGNIIQGEKVPKGMGIAGHVATTGEALIVNDVKTDPRHFKGIDERSLFDTRNLICVPMKVIDRLVGVLEVVNTIGREGFDQADRKLLAYIADQAAIAINNRMLYDDLRARVEELASLYEISQTLSCSASEDDVFDELLYSLTKCLGVEKASVMLYDESQQRLVLAARRGLPPDALGNAGMMESISGYVFRSGDPIIVTDIDKELSFPFLNRKEHYKTKSFISIPIRYKERTIGVISMADKKNGSCFDAFDLRLFTTVSAHVAEVYENLRNQKGIESRRRLEQEIDIASEIQRKILPRIPEKVLGHTIAAYNRPAKEVGGDFYDFGMVGESKYSVLVADVSGKGIPAALFMGSSRNIVRAEARINSQPGHLLQNSNRYIYEDSEHGMFITMFYMLVDTHNRLITYSSAGHNEQLLIKGSTGEVIRMKASGIPLGLLPDSEYEEKVLFYEDGDLILMFTDGILEYLGGVDLEEGEKLFMQAVRANRHATPAQIIAEFARMIEQADGHADFIDDFTIVAIRF